MRYTPEDYTTKHPALSSLLAQWQIAPYTNGSNPRPTPTHSAMGSFFENPDELADYAAAALADIPHSDIVADFRRGEARPYYTRDGYVVDAMHLVTVLGSAPFVLPPEPSEYLKLMASAIRIHRHFSTKTSEQNFRNVLGALTRAPEHAEVAAMLIGRHGHYPDTAPRGEVYRNRVFIEVLGVLELGASAIYIDHLASASEVYRGNTLRYGMYAIEWEEAGVAPEYAGTVAAAAERAYGLGLLTSAVIALWNSGVPATYVVACATQHVALEAVVPAWERGIPAEYAGALGT